MTRIGVLGLGMMGNTHLAIYAGRDDVSVEAVADQNPARLDGSEQAGGNIEGQVGAAFDLSTVRAYEDGLELIDKEDLDLIDVCLPTPLHFKFAQAALEKGRHVLIEKPLCRNAEDAARLVDLAKKYPKSLTMPAMCIRFWPGWEDLRKAIKDGRYGSLRSLNVQRLSTHPGGPFYHDAAACGAAALDLHIHDTDFVYSCLGMPRSVHSIGYSQVTEGCDHIHTQYRYDDDVLVTAEGGWAMAEDFPFTMRFLANFEKATVSFNLEDGPKLSIWKRGGGHEVVELSPEMGYAREIDYFLGCLKAGAAPDRVTLQDGANALKIYEAEMKSLKEMRGVSL